MQIFSTVIGRWVGLALPLALAACATEKPPVATALPVTPVLSSDAILRQSQGMAHLSERLKTGESMIEQGNATVREGQTKIDEGNRLIDEGRKIKREAEDSYRNIRN